MDGETVKAKMLAQVDAARHSKMAAKSGWLFEIDGLTMYVTLRRGAEPGRDYVLRAQFDEFPKRAPSYVFVDPKTKTDVPQCWPPGVKHSEGAICTPGTREFHERIHPNDAQYAWDPERYTVLGTVRMIHRMAEKGA